MVTYKTCLLTAFSAIILGSSALADETPRRTSAGAALTGESCDLSTRTDIVPVEGMPLSQSIICNAKHVGGVAHTPAPVTGGETTSTADARAALIQAFNASAPWARLRQGVQCDAPQWREDGGETLVLPCRRSGQGWASIIVAAKEGDRIVIADGPVTLYPVLRAAIGKPLPAGWTVENVKVHLLSFWQAPIMIAGVDEVAALETLLAEARTAASLENFDDAERFYREALAIQTRNFGAEDVAVGDTLIDLALVVSNLGRGEEAAALFRRAAPIMERSTDAMHRARLVTYRGYESANLGRFEEALEFAEQAVETWRTLAADPTLPGGTAKSVIEAELAFALNLKGQMLLRAGDLITAYASSGEALLILDRVQGEPRWWRADVLMAMGDIAIAQSRLSAAETYYRNALRERQEVFGEGRGTLRARAALGRAYQIEGMNEAAIVAYREAFSIVRTLPRGSVPFSNQDLVPFAAAAVAHARTFDDAEARQGLYAEVFDAFQFVRSPVIERTISLTSARLAAGDKEAAGLIRTLQDTSRALAVTRIRLAYAQSATGTERNIAMEDRLAMDAVRLNAELRQARETLETRFPGIAGLIDQAPIALDRLRQNLAGGEAVVSFMVGRDQSFVQLVKREGVFIGHVPRGAADLRETVESLRRSLEIEGRSVNDLDLVQSHQLHTDLFGDIAPAMQGVDRLAVVPGGPLASLPFSLLVTEPPKSRDYRSASWLIRSVSVTHTPSLASFLTLRTAHPARLPDRPMLAFGDPRLGAVKSGAARARAIATLNTACRTDVPMDAAELRTLGSLPETLTEMQSVAQTLGAPASAIHAGSTATENGLRGQELDRYRVLYFATHGLLPGELRCQMEPALVLSPPPQTPISRAEDGLLEASEVAALSLNSDLVVLSACNTAAGVNELGGEAMFGLSEAFFHAGARNMLISHWQVPSAATARLMSTMFRGMDSEGSMDAARALQAAQLGRIADAETAHPFFWAAFVLTGDGGLTRTQLAGGL